MTQCTKLFSAQDFNLAVIMLSMDHSLGDMDHVYLPKTSVKGTITGDSGDSPDASKDKINRC